MQGNLDHASFLMHETAQNCRLQAYFPRTQKTVAFWSLHFGAGEPLSSSFLESHNLDAERPFLQQQCVEKKLEVEKKTCRGRKQDGPIARSRKRHFGVEKKSSPHGFIGKAGADLRGLYLQTRNLPRTTVLSEKQARTLLRAFGNYKVTIGTYPNWSSKSSIPCRSRAPSLAIVWGEGGVRIK